MGRVLALVMLAALWAWVVLDRPTPTPEFVRTYCPDAVTDSELEECTEAHF